MAPPKHNVEKSLKSLIFALEFRLFEQPLFSTAFRNNVKVDDITLKIVLRCHLL